MSETAKYEPPRPTGKDLAHSVVRAAVSAMPYIGSPAVELFNTVIGPPLAKRQLEWMESVAEALRQLEAHAGVRLDDLQNHEVFTTAVMQASQIAQRTHQREKLDALRNAVLNSALPGAPDDSFQQMFLNWVDRFTEWHLRVLRFYADPPGWRARNLKIHDDYPGVSNPANVLRDIFPELATRPHLFDHVLRDLEESGLLEDVLPGATVTYHARGRSYATPMGKRFLDYIEQPTLAGA